MSQNEANAEHGSEQTSLEGSVKVGSTEIEAVADDSDREILGWVVPFTIGNDFTVPRSWLEQRASELNLSHSALPSETTPRRAFTRAGREIQDKAISELEQSEEKIDIHIEKVKYEKTFRLEAHDRRSDTEFSGDLLATIEYDSDSLNTFNWNPKISVDHNLWGAAQEYIGAFEEAFELHKLSNTGRDIRGMITDFFQTRSQSVKFRAGGGVYFAPLASEDVVQAFDQLVTDINNEHKSRGFPCELDTIEVADSEEKRSMVEEKVRRDLERQVEEVIDEALEELTEGDVLVDELLDAVESELEGVSGFAEQYNALLDTEMSVRECLEEWKLTATGEAKDLVDEVIEDL